MKKLSIILAAAAFAVWLVVDMVREFFANDTIQYFSTEPRRVLYVVAIGIVGGLLALGFDLLAHHLKRRVKIFAWGAAASTLTAIVVYFVINCLSLLSVIPETGGGGWIAMALLLFASIAGYLWLEFYRALKAKSS